MRRLTSLYGGRTVHFQASAKLVAGLKNDHFAVLFAQKLRFCQNGTRAVDALIFGASGMVGRGVLLDIARHQGVDWLPDGFAITNDMLDQCAKAQNVEVGRGDDDNCGSSACSCVVASWLTASVPACAPGWQSTVVEALVSWAAGSARKPWQRRGPFVPGWL